MSSSPLDDEQKRARIEAFYHKFAPMEMSKVENALKANVTQEKLFLLLREKYGVTAKSAEEDPIAFGKVPPPVTVVSPTATATATTASETTTTTTHELTGRDKVEAFYKIYAPTEVAKVDTTTRVLLTRGEADLFSMLRTKYNVAEGSPASGPGTQPVRPQDARPELNPASNNNRAGTGIDNKQGTPTRNAATPVNAASPDYNASRRTAANVTPPPPSNTARNINSASPSAATTPPLPIAVPTNTAVTTAAAPLPCVKCISLERQNNELRQHLSAVAEENLQLVEQLQQVTAITLAFAKQMKIDLPPRFTSLISPALSRTGDL